MLLVLGLCIALPFSLSSTHWYTDSLYYEAQKLEVTGTRESTALHDVFTGNLATALEGHLPSPPRLPEYAQFYRRRWTVPAMAAALTPLFGTASLLDVSLLGWAVLAPLLFLLLRRRFSRRTSIVASGISMLLPPLLMWAPTPLVDSWGVSMLVAGFLLALLTKDDLRWLPVWIAAVLVGSFTRDVGLVLVLSIGWVALRERSRRMALIAGTGVLASAPAPLIFSAPLQTNLAYLLNGSHIPDGHASWGWILSRYPGAVTKAIAADLAYPFHVAPAYAVLAFAFTVPVVVGLWLLFRSDGTPLLALMRGAAVAAVVPILLSPNYTGLRLELVFVPAIATGFALLFDARHLYRVG
jgi:hypothetical protein